MHRRSGTAAPSRCACGAPKHITGLHALAGRGRPRWIAGSSF